MNQAPELTSEEKQEVERLMQTQGWLGARDYLRTRGYSVEQANRVVLPRRQEVPAHLDRPAERQASGPWWVNLIRGAAEFFSRILPFTR